MEFVALHLWGGCPATTFTGEAKRRLCSQAGTVMLRSWKLWHAVGLVRTVGSYSRVLSRHHLFHVPEMVTFIRVQGVDSKLGVESGRLIEGDRPV